MRSKKPGRSKIDAEFSKLIAPGHGGVAILVVNCKASGACSQRRGRVVMMKSPASKVNGGFSPRAKARQGYNMTNTIKIGAIIPHFPDGFVQLVEP